MHRRIEHIAAELLICRSPASISNYIFSAVFTYFLGGFLRKKRWLLGRSPRPRWGSLQRSPTPPSWAGGVPPSRTLPGPAPPILRPTPCHTLAGAPPPPPSQFLDPPLGVVKSLRILFVGTEILYLSICTVHYRNFSPFSLFPLSHDNMKTNNAFNIRRTIERT